MAALITPHKFIYAVTEFLYMPIELNHIVIIITVYLIMHYFKKLLFFLFRRETSHSNEKSITRYAKTNL